MAGVARRPPRLHLFLLGMGKDGHTASLFPGTAALEGDERWVVAHDVAKLATKRITMTPPLINAAALHLSRVRRRPKADVLRASAARPARPPTLSRAAHLPSSPARSCGSSIVLRLPSFCNTIEPRLEPRRIRSLRQRHRGRDKSRGADSSRSPRPTPCAVVIFGVTGDLSKRKARARPSTT